MRPLKHILLFFTLSSVIFSCQEKVVQKGENISAAQSIQHLEVSIEGMTCEIGCAKLIESKIHKLEGITFSKVNYEHKIGQFTFDTNKISQEELTKNINGIAGGDLYKVTSTTVVDKFTELPKTLAIKE